MKKKTKTPLANILLLFLTILILLITLEAITPALYKKLTNREFSAIQIQEKINSPEIKNHGGSWEKILHPYLGFIRNSNIDKNANKHGLFGTIPIQKKSSNKYIIGIFGGSFAENLFLDSIETLKEELKKSEKFKDKEIIILSLASESSKQPQQLISLNYFLIHGAEFDSIVNLDGFNELAFFAYNATHGTYPYFPAFWSILSRNGLILEQAKKLNQIESINKKRHKLQKIASIEAIGHCKFCLAISELAEIKLNNKKQALETEISESYSSKNQPIQIAGPFEAFESKETMFKKAIEVWRLSSIQMSRLSKINNINYFHFLQPNQYFKDSKTLTEEEQAKAINDDEGNIFRYGATNGYPFFDEEINNLKKENINFTDLRLIFQNENQTLYIDSCCHVNKPGSDIVAKEIAKKIIEAY